MHGLRARYGDWGLVTGASSGIGAAFAEELAARGMNLVLVARRIEVLEGMRARLSAEHGVEVRCVQVDLAQDGCVEVLAGACAGIELGLVVNNAGSGVPGRFSQSDIEDEKSLVQLNCLTPVEITRHFLPGMLARRRGGVILVSSLMGFQGVPFMANYSATKGFLLNFGEALHHECAGTGVDILVVAPGATETPGKYLHEVDYDQLPIHWMSAAAVVDLTLANLGKKPLVVPGLRNHLMACVGGGLWSRRWVQRVMRWLAPRALPRKPE